VLTTRLSTLESRAKNTVRWQKEIKGLPNRKKLASVLLQGSGVAFVYEAGKFALLIKNGKSDIQFNLFPQTLV
jgi:hypothetical protein